MKYLAEIDIPVKVSAAQQVHNGERRRLPLSQSPLSLSFC
jgi:hypothetical protein